MKTFIARCKMVVWILASLSPFQAANANEETDLAVGQIAAEFYLDQKDWTTAETEIESVLSRHPQNSRFLMYRAVLVENRDHAHRSAYETLKVALKNTQVPSLKFQILDQMATVQDAMGKKSFANRLREYSRKYQGPNGRKKSWSGWAGALAGYDSNVLMASDTARALISKSDIASTFINAVGGIRLEPAFAPGFWVQTSFSYRHHQNQAVAAFNTWVQSLNIGIKPAIRLGKSSDLFFVNATDLVYLRPKSFEFFSLTNVIQSMIQTRHSAAQSNYGLHLRYQKFSTENLTDGSQNRSGPGVRALYQIAAPIHPWTFKGTAFGDVQFTRGSEYRYRQLGANATVAFSGSPLWSADWTISGQRTDYYNSSTKRLDAVFNSEWGLRYSLGPQWNSRIFYAYEKSNSNVKTAQYSKGTITAMLAFSF